MGVTGSSPVACTILYKAVNLNLVGMENSKKSFPLWLPSLEKIKNRISKIFRFTDREWYPYAVSALTAADVFVGVIPSDALLVSAVLGRPKKWIKIGLMFAIGNFFRGRLTCGNCILGCRLVKRIFSSIFPK